MRIKNREAKPKDLASLLLLLTSYGSAGLLLSRTTRLPGTVIIMVSDSSCRTFLPIQATAAAEIGRASCRERV